MCSSELGQRFMSVASLDVSGGLGVAQMMVDRVVASMRAVFGSEENP